MVSNLVCRSDNLGLLTSMTVADAPVNGPGLAALLQPYPAQQAELLSAPPVEAFVAGGIFLAAIFLGMHRGLLRFSAVRTTLRVTAIMAAIACTALTAAWGTLRLAVTDAEQGNYSSALTTMQRLEQPFSYLGWIGSWKSNPATILAENTAVSAIQTALAKGDAQGSLHFVEWPVARSPEGRFARRAAFTANASASLHAGDLPEALRFSEKAVDADPGATRATQNVYAVRAHMAFRSLQQSHFTEAKQHLEQIAPAWKPALYSRLIERIARDEVVQQLNSRAVEIFNADSTALAAGEQTLAAALSKVKALGQQSVALECSLGSVLQARAIQAFHAKQYAETISLLTRQERLISGSAATNVLFVDALIAQGSEDVRAGKADPAIHHLEWAWRRDAARKDEILPRLSQAYLLRSFAQRDARELDAALASAIRAQELSRSELTENNLAEVRVALAERALSRGKVPEATALLQTVRANPRFTARADAVLYEMRSSQWRIGNINRILAWGTVPRVCGEVPADLNGDRRLDVYVYSNCDGTPLGWMSATDRSRVIFVQPGQTDRVLLTLHDSDGNGYFDLWQWPEGTQGAFRGVLDKDGDSLPDVRFHRTSAGVQEEGLSGRILIRVVSGVIARKTDFLSKPDGYFNIWQNGRHVYRSRTVDDTHYPVWNSGPIIHYRFGDVVVAELKDEDVFWADEPVGALTWRSLPKSGRYVTANKAAALEIRVEPSDLPVGFRFQGPPVANGFRFPQGGLTDPALRDVVLRTQHAEKSGEIYSFLGNAALTELAVLTLVPRANLAVQLLVGLGVSTMLPN